MAEAIHCPSCSTRYRLQPERLTEAIRRARCFTCSAEFPIADLVQRLLPSQDLAATGAFSLGDWHPLHPESEPTPTSPSLTLGDLESVDADLLESSLLEAESSALPAPAEPEPAPPEPAETTLSGYTSARDAIDKLFGNTPIEPAGMKISQEPETMDLEATLSALDTTLGAEPEPPSPVATDTLGDGPTAPGLVAEDLAGPSTSTMRLSQEDLLAAIAAAGATPAGTERKDPGLVATAAPRIEVAPHSFAPQFDAPEVGTDLLRLKVGEEIYSGLTMPQLVAWVEEGRILENHLVARQHSENWLEAHKVPGLRPVFERLRRERNSPPGTDASADLSPKKSLFGGLFGKG